ncbi:MAG: phosphoglycerate dehydrogenase [Planctomycetota bacterium]|nr:MAG: phosphoglycerate dehydrogenase [Planctomycetota bacterium]
MHKVLITGKINEIGLKIFENDASVEVDYKPDYPYAKILKIIENYDCILSRSETAITKELIEKGTKLKLIARAAVGIENIDIDCATKNGILVINTPAQNTNSAAELTMAIILSASRNVIGAHNKMKEGGWDRHNFTGSELLDKRIGIIGLGNVGHRVAKFARGFDMEVIAYDPYLADSKFEEFGAKKTDLKELLRTSDIVSLHVPKVPETIGMIGKNEIELMKDDVILVNAARGGIIQEDHLIDALKNNKIKFACLDTFEIEPMNNAVLRSFQNVVLTPHIGASTIEAQKRIATTIATQTIRGLHDEIVDSPVNMPKVSIMEDSPVRAYSVLTEKLGVLANILTDFVPEKIDFQYRGELAHQETSLLKLSFLKGLLGKSTDYPVTFVNAESLAESKGIQIQHENDEQFSAYNSAIKIKISKPGHSFTVGGIVFERRFQRITLINEFYFEVDAEGILLSITNEDKPGVVGNVGSLLANLNINIQQMDLSRNRNDGKAMSFISIDKQLSKEAITQLKELPHILDVKVISF